MGRRARHFGAMGLLGLILALTAPLTPASGKSAVATKKAADVRLYILDCGYLRTTDTSNYAITPQEAGTTDMAVPCYLIGHNKDWLLFDAGIGDAHAGRADKVLDMTLEVPGKIGPQLKRIGVAPSAVRYVAVSHYHYDHVGNISAFRKATLLVQRAEAERMLTKPYPFGPNDAVPRLKAGKTQQVDGDHDVFGDGSVMLIATPGHSPGHQSMLVRLARTGPVILTGDLWHYSAERRLGRTPIHEVGNRQTPVSRARIESLARDEKAQVWIEHDLDLFKTQRHAPEFYD